jgi:hypothetical protein
VLGVPRPHVSNIDELMKLVRELPTKRGRTEVSASFKLGSAGAVGRHTKNSENLIQTVSAARARTPVGDGRGAPPFDEQGQEYTRKDSPIKRLSPCAFGRSGRAITH